MGSFTGVVQLKLTICDTVAVTGKSASYWGWKMSLDQAERLRDALRGRRISIPYKI